MASNFTEHVGSDAKYVSIKVQKAGNVVVDWYALDVGQGAQLYERLVAASCGFSARNSNPTICINDLVKEHNKLHDKDLPEFTTEELIARAVTITEGLLKQGVHLDIETGPQATIVGLDHSGSLSVAMEDGEEVSVEPDGNSFDMFKSLITKKTRP
ncbi:biotin--protein ligase-like [Branchiostoma lanceolatum]|uniref:biotin--protein ligase-like n=1 Tax=Branchiostoma lanceolatum TaxID=7740 RepID=UPI003454B010